MACLKSVVYGLVNSVMRNPETKPEEALKRFLVKKPPLVAGMEKWRHSKGRNHPRSQSSQVEQGWEPGSPESSVLGSSTGLSSMQPLSLCLKCLPGLSALQVPPVFQIPGKKQLESLLSTEAAAGAEMAGT